MEQALPERISKEDLSQMSSADIRETVNNLRGICGLEPDSTLIKASLKRLMDKYERIWEYTRAWIMEQELKLKKEKEMAKKKDTKQTEMKKVEKKDQKPAAGVEPAGKTTEKAPEITEITDRMALLALAKIAGWESNDPFIGNGSDDVVKVTAEDGTETELKAMTDDQCKMELGENIGMLTPEDQKAVEAMENGPAIWAKFTSLREDLSKTKIAEEKKKTKAESKKADTAQGGGTKLPKAPKEPKPPAAPRYTRSDAFAEALKKSPKTVSELIADSDKIYAGKGGKANEKEAKWMAGYAIKLLTAMKLVEIDGDEIKSIAGCILES